MSTCSPSDSSRVIFTNEPEIHNYDSFAELVDHSTLYYYDIDYRPFVVEADDMEDTRCKLEEAIQAMQKRKRTGAIDEEEQGKRKE